MIEEGESVLKVIRTRLGYTQEQLAVKLGTASVTVSRWERGTAEPTLTLAQVKALSRELKKIGMTIDNLPNTFGPLPPEGASP